MSDTEDGEKISLKVKTTTETHQIRVKADATVKEVKEVLLKLLNGVALEQICLIFSGKILKDPDSLQTLGIGDGLTVHLVVRNRPASTAASSSQSHSTPTVTSAQTPPDLANLMNPGGLGFGGTNLAAVQQQLMSNPDSLRQMMDNPMIQGMLSNPEILRSIFVNNPQMQQLIERNPEVGHMLNNPEMLRQTMEMVRNPAMLQELMRNHDRAVSNLEAVPGGMAALQRMYRDIQEPMLDAATQQLSSQNPFAALVENSDVPAESTSGNAGVENRDPLPNPWAPRSPNRPAPNTSTTPNAPAASGTAGVFNSPGYQSLLQQMTGSPEMMQNLLEGPHMQSMMEMMATNPEVAEMMFSSNPMFANNPQLRDQVRSGMPQLLQQMRNPEVRRALTNPRVTRALQQIQEGMQILQTEAPALLPTLNLPVGLPTVPASNPTATQQPNPPAAIPNSSAPGGMPNSPEMNGLMAQMIRAMGANSLTPAAPQMPPEQRYQAELDQLASMGFPNREANVRALIASFGDINGAIERLLSQGP